MGPTTQTSKILGILFLLPLLSYATGNNMVETLLQKPGYLQAIEAERSFYTTGILLMLLNSATVVAIGVMLFPILKKISPGFALAYLSTRLIESILLLVGIVGLLVLIPSGEVAMLEALAPLAIRLNYFSYQVAMLFLGLGSIVFCICLYHRALIPKFIAVWGMSGYGLLATGSILELFDIKVGILLSIPGGLFELTLSVWLLGKGFSPVATVTRP